MLTVASDAFLRNIQVILPVLEKLVPRIEREKIQVDCSPFEYLSAGQWLDGVCLGVPWLSVAGQRVGKLSAHLVS